MSFPNSSHARTQNVLTLLLVITALIALFSVGAFVYLFNNDAMMQADVMEVQVMQESAGSTPSMNDDGVSVQKVEHTSVVCPYQGGCMEDELPFENVHGTIMAMGDGEISVTIDGAQQTFAFAPEVTYAVLNLPLSTNDTTVTQADFHVNDQVMLTVARATGNVSGVTRIIE